MTFPRNFLIGVFVLVFRSTSPTEGTPIDVDDPDVCNTLSCQEAAKSLRNSMNTSIDPCEDFFQYACGGWIENNPIPEDEYIYTTMDITTKVVSARVTELLTSALDGNHARPILQAAILFHACMDEDAREAQGLEPLKNFLNSIGGWPLIDPEWSHVGYQWEEEVANAIRSAGVAAIISAGVVPDDMDSSRHILYIDQAEFGLKREQLLNVNSSTEEYRNYIVQAGKLLNPNVDEAQLISDANEIINFEAALAQFSTAEEEKKDPDFYYNKMTVTEADRITENTYFNWKDFLNVVLQDYPEVTDETEILVVDIEYIKNALKLAHDTHVRTVANYIGMLSVKELGDHTTQEFRDNSLAFISAAIAKEVETPAALKAPCYDKVTELFGFAVGRLYVDAYFTEEEKRDVEMILEDIRSTFEITLNHNKWMDPDTRDKALAKLRSMTDMVAYPPWIKSDQELTYYYRSVPDLNRDEYFASLLKTLHANAGMELQKWNQPTQKTTEWVTTPSVVNAFYQPNANTITFPAGILNLPEYKFGRPMALNYGALGATIGHEISHGFDNTGSQYDKEGDLVDWWSKETKVHFNSKTTCFRRQYSSYKEPTTNLNLNGNLTIGDDIADNGGVRNAFLAYRVRVLEAEDLQQTTTVNKRLPGIDATPEQLFFLGYATASCSHAKRAGLAYMILYSDHTLNQYRIIVPLSNCQEFAEAFNCPAGSAMNPESKCVLW